MKHTLRDVVVQTEHSTGCLSGRAPHLIPTGIERLDNTFGGLSPGIVTVLGALDGTGKSTMSLYMAFERAKSGHRTAVLSTQDPADVVGVRLLSYMTGINGLNVRRGSLSEFDRARLARAGEELGRNEDILTYFPSGRLQPVLHDMEEAASEGCDFIFIDYLQNLHIAGFRGDRRNEIDRMLGDIRDCAAKHNLAVMLLSQMRRLPPGFDRDYTRSDLKESSTIGETARLVLILNKDRKDAALTHCVVDKSSWGGDNVVASFRRATSGMLVPV